MGKSKVQGSGGLYIHNAKTKEFYSTIDTIPPGRFVQFVAAKCNNIPGGYSSRDGKSYSAAKMLHGDILVYAIDESTSYYSCYPVIRTAKVSKDVVSPIDTLSIKLSVDAVVASVSLVEVSKDSLVAAYTSKPDNNGYANNYYQMIYIKVDATGKITQAAISERIDAYYASPKMYLCPNGTEGQFLSRMGISSKANDAAYRIYEVSESGFKRIGDDIPTTDSYPLFYLDEGLIVTGNKIIRTDGATVFTFGVSITGTAYFTPVSKDCFLAMSVNSSTLAFRYVYKREGEWKQGDQTVWQTPGRRDHGGAGICYTGNDRFALLYPSGESPYPGTSFATGKIENGLITDIEPLDVSLPSNVMGYVSCFISITSTQHIVLGGGSYYGPYTGVGIFQAFPFITLEPSVTAINGVTREKCTTTKAGKTYVLKEV